MKCVIGIFALAGAGIFATAGHAAFVFDFAGAAGSTLHSSQSGQVAVTDPSSGITLTLNAEAIVQGSTGVFFQSTSSSRAFGINESAGGDAASAIDGDNGVESARFFISADMPLASLQMVGFEVSGTGLGESGRFVIDGGSTTNFTDEDVLAVNELILAGQELSLEFVSGNGFSLVSMTFDAAGVTPVPEPTTLVLIGLAGGGAAALRRRKRPHAC
ncbi:PEP-CTERM sorting domain-containing protein [Crateriforma conspicua]|uniref:PEP-CTERM sorting domain-containing protein n=1 Tax=Crateriforma conspicua TaxID=2527996 RepID=UPI00118B735C|nr:PEP-CTERM sorting domain-containing protein [Crateriforma conspicua]QDV65950.1 PEP-CTERM motif protein [Crateriforma conspicua]